MRPEIMTTGIFTATTNSIKSYIWFGLMVGWLVNRLVNVGHVTLSLLLLLWSPTCIRCEDIAWCVGGTSETGCTHLAYDHAK